MEDAHNEDVGLDKTVGFVGSNNFMEMELGIRKKVNRENVKPKRFFYQRLWVCSDQVLLVTRPFVSDLVTMFNL